MSWIVVVSGYLLGSIPTAYILGRLLKGKDIRQMGDGNMGARNAYHELGVRAGIAVFFIDAAKGALAVIIALVAGLPQVFVLITGAAAVIGHNWPVFVGFRGGRGESTTIGVLLTLVTLPALIVAGPTVATLVIKKNVTIASCVMFMSLPLVCWVLGVPGLLIAYSIEMPCLVGLTHFLKTRRAVETSGAGSV
jgi:glycerol-3-phosphate acyltransferase PlsY